MAMLNGSTSSKFSFNKLRLVVSKCINREKTIFTTFFSEDMCCVRELMYG